MPVLMVNASEHTESSLVPSRWGNLENDTTWNAFRGHILLVDTDDQNNAV